MRPGLTCQINQEQNILDVSLIQQLLSFGSLSITANVIKLHMDEDEQDMSAITHLISETTVASEQRSLDSCYEFVAIADDCVKKSLTKLLKNLSHDLMHCELTELKEMNADKKQQLRFKWLLESKQPLTWIKTRLADYCQAFSMDYYCLPEKQTLDDVQLMVFDMDSTFITIEVIDELAKYAGVGKEVARVTEQAMQGELDFNASLQARMALLKGLSAEKVNELKNKLPVTAGVENLVNQAHARQCKVVIASGGFMPFALQLKQQFNLYDVVANELEIENNQLTGKVKLPIVNAESKANVVKNLMQQFNLTKQEIVVVGDGANDLLMMHEAGLGIAFHAKEKVRQQANAVINHADMSAVACLLNWD